jgi:hypothetical protein
MFIFLAITFTAIVAVHRALLKAVENYNYGYGTHEEWREFERQFQHEDAIRF